MGVPPVLVGDAILPLNFFSSFCHVSILKTLTTLVC
jgi:hypothetical protein